ncbi:aromatic ring-hydroxylating dioxygenase subunit alpha [Nocardia otitidiscaviarum]|uniref:3-ketosteroid-9-alpha-hydroxylase oxygenase subunit n=1 Tax=Nocardia otitidiscaviarum TaxID=1823 RepID=A0A379JLJ4_9NOCA|nr:aromatic ring-hydroxylating dioxygenase subunit alpha [Nocardia otitidiscaviarum]MBF6135588.1 aromatic ring-hydroxylating dioxygenase subunit alpha [Nocardia otitidiscaviarum]MBF6487405.1 aromatic ring-hydroxylating dioxygenase subunit alpha [Nocardia otitidiscaviarum]SUD49244.1 3-ketosteroid-9-alpha-hydroxylase oxygenase subunit [Nocardia otitidiscaviarum]
MLKNFWYALEFADRIGRQPRKVTCLGQDFVLFRTRSGTVTCLSDLCVHRGGALSMGTVTDDCIACPYHGWQYNSEGVCVKIPANAEERKIPRKARIDAYPTVERYGMVWAFLGDLPEAERPPIPVIPEHDDPEFRVVQFEMEIDANYERALENVVDAAHTPFVHGTSFGNPDKPEIPDFRIRQTDWSAEADIQLSPPLPTGLWGLLARRRPRPESVTVTNAWYLPNIVKLHIRLPIGDMLLYDFNIPLSQERTLVKILGYRNFFTGAWADGNARKRIEKILLQDRPVVESQRPELLPFDLSDELHVRSDGLQVAYRRRRLELRKQGWWVGDDDIITGDSPRRTATVIASPARRDNPELASAWVHKARTGGNPE